MNYHRLTLLFIFLLLFTGQWLEAEAGSVPDDARPVEQGSVQWLRDFDLALRKSEKSGKPVLALFQEIPGCLGCKTFGAEVLSHPLLVEAIETEFHPVLVYNNRPGSGDADLLRKYGEPAWNYQVIRFFDHHGRDIIPRKDRVWDIADVARRMIQALAAYQRKVPRYLAAVSREHNAAAQRTAVFSMACYWTGEYLLGGIEGVVTTEAGWYEGREVTLVSYEPEMLSLAALIEKARANRCAGNIYLHPSDYTETMQKQYRAELFSSANYSKASSQDQKKQLQQWSRLKAITSLTPMQMTKLNAWLPRDRQEALSWLSPRQLQQLGLH